MADPHDSLIWRCRPTNTIERECYAMLGEQRLQLSLFLLNNEWRLAFRHVASPRYLHQERFARAHDGLTRFNDIKEDPWTWLTAAIL